MPHSFITKLGTVGFLLAIAWPGPLQAQDRGSISGYVQDATSGEPLLGANVRIADTTIGAATNDNGYYSLTNLTAGTYTLVCSYVGYRSTEMEVEVDAGASVRMDVELIPDDVAMGEVVVQAEEQTREELSQLGRARLDPRTVTQMPTVLEPDVFRSLQMLPGVKGASDYSSGLYIRGGSPDQTLVLLDETKVYSPSHLFGLFSTFNPDAIKDVQLYKGAYPAEFGGRLGAVVDIHNKDGNRRQYDGNVSVGLLASRALVEGPYEKGSWMLAVRRSTLEPLLAVLNKNDVEGLPEGFYFYDLNGKVNYDAGPNNKLSLGIYSGQDQLDFPFGEDFTTTIRYGNRVFSGSWTHIFSDALFAEFTATGSQYFSLPTFSLGGTSFGRTNRIYDYAVKGDLEYNPGEKHTVEGGFWSGRYMMCLKDTFDEEVGINREMMSLYGSVYLQDTWEPVTEWRVQGGLRGSYFARGQYLRLAPRMSIEYHPWSGVRFQAGAGRYFQYLSSTTSELSSGFDVWLTAAENVPPAFGDQAALGVKLDVPYGVRIDIEGYYRTMRELFELDPRLTDTPEGAYRTLFHFGRGYAYGTELLIERSQGRLNGQLAYTFGVTRRRFPDVNDGAFYPPKYDRTHEITAVLRYELSDHWQFASVFSYASGQPYTRPTARYEMVDDPFQSQPRNIFVTAFNNERLPVYHRWDLGVTRSGRIFDVADYRLQVQVVNVYGRRNTWFYLFQTEDDRISRTAIPQIPIPLPNLSFSLDF